jgi:SAF domain
MGDMSLRLRGAAVRPDRQPDTADNPASPQGARQRRTRWRDPRLWLGIVLVLASVAVGARVLASADDTVAVWEVAHDVPAGREVDTSDLRVTQVHFDEAAVAEQYVPAGQPLGPGAHATRDLHAGEILAASAVSSAATPAIRELPLGVGAAHEPADLRAGDHVEVWAVPGSSTGDGTGGRSAPTLVLRDVTVLSVGSSGVGVSGERQVLVGLDPAVDIGSVLRETTGASVVLVRLAG